MAFCLFLHVQRLEKTQPTSARNQSKSNQLICTHPQIQTTPPRATARERDAAPEAQAAAVTVMTRGRHFPSPPSISQSSTGDFSRQHPDTRRTPSRMLPPPGFQPAAEREQNKSNYRCTRAPLPGESSARCTGEPQLLQAGLTQPSTPRFIFLLSFTSFGTPADIPAAHLPRRDAVIGRSSAFSHPPPRCLLRGELLTAAGRHPRTSHHQGDFPGGRIHESLHQAGLASTEPQRTPLFIEAQRSFRADAGT